MFSICIASFDEATETLSIIGASVYGINIGEKNADGTYPITIEKLTDVNIGGGSGSGSNIGGDSLLNLVNTEDWTIRTSITETEKVNIRKGKYTSVFYYDPSAGETAILTSFFPKQAMSLGDNFVFSSYKFSLDNSSSSITGVIVYSLDIGNDKNQDGTYPITIGQLTTLPITGVKITFKD